MADWVTEGVSTRSRFGHPSPVVHLIVVERSELWCTGSPGRAASIHHQAITGYPPPRVCKACRELAAEAIADEVLEEADVPRFTDGRRP